MNSIKTLFFILCFLVFFFNDCKSIEKKNNHNKILNLNSNVEKRLIQDLFENYDKSNKPSDTVDIKFSLNLNQIITLIEQDQILVLNVFLDHQWIDPRLKWNPNEYLNITLLRVKSDLFWS
jgi:hypothetical protein